MSLASDLKRSELTMEEADSEDYTISIQTRLTTDVLKISTNQIVYISITSFALKAYIREWSETTCNCFQL